MDLQSEQIREQQKGSWNKFSAAWKRLGEIFMDIFRPIGVEIIQMINPKKILLCGI